MTRSRYSPRTSQYQLLFSSFKTGDDYQAVMAGSVLVSIPPLIVFPIFQKNFVRDIAFTELKG